MEIQLLSLNDLMISAAWEKSDSCAFSTPPFFPYYVSSLFLSFASLSPLAFCSCAIFSFFMSHSLSGFPYTSFYYCLSTVHKYNCGEVRVCTALSPTQEVHLNLEHFKTCIADFFEFVFGAF